MLFVFFQILSFSLSSDQQDNDCAAYNVSLHVSGLCLPGIAQDPQYESGKFPPCLFPLYVTFKATYTGMWVRLYFCLCVGGLYEEKVLHLTIDMAVDNYNISVEFEELMTRGLQAP